VIASSDPQAAPELIDLPAGDWDRLTVAEHELRGPAQLRAQLDSAVQVCHVLAVHAHEPVGFPATLDL
jgi:hypothetical protein